MRKSGTIVILSLLAAPFLSAQETQPLMEPAPPVMQAPPAMTPLPTLPALPADPTMPVIDPGAAITPTTELNIPPAMSQSIPGAPPPIPQPEMTQPPVPSYPGTTPQPVMVGVPPMLQSAPTQPPETAPAQAKKPMEIPDFVGIAGWINSEPLTKASLKGKVVLVDFWTYSCVNCVRTLPYLKEWYKKYKDRGFVIVGVHSPEFEFEKDVNNVRMSVQKFGITYPVALDSQMATWAAYQNNVWPAHYFIDATGKVRHIHLGEGEYEQSEKMIQKLIMERDLPKPPESQPATQPAETQPETKAVETQPAPARKKGRRGKAAAETQPAASAAAAPGKTPETKPAPLPALSKNAPNVDFTQIKSPETYLGLIRRERLVTSGRPIEMNEWMYDGKWRTEGDRIVLAEGTGKLFFRFNATKVNLVLAPTAGGVQAVIKLDGQPLPADKAGVDVKNGTLMITEPRMYELINLGAQGSEHIIEIEFLNPGAAAYAFTFG